jgi:hypothetical protein
VIERAPRCAGTTASSGRAFARGRCRRGSAKVCAPPPSPLSRLRTRGSKAGVCTQPPGSRSATLLSLPCSRLHALLVPSSLSAPLVGQFGEYFFWWGEGGGVGGAAWKIHPSPVMKRIHQAPPYNRQISVTGGHMRGTSGDALSSPKQKIDSLLVTMLLL